MLLSVKAIEEKRQGLLDQIEAIQAVAKEENRDLTEEDSTTIDELLNQWESLGEKDLVRAQKIEDAQKYAVSKRTSTPATPAPITSGFEPAKPKIAAVPRSPVKLRSFKGETAEKDAYQSGMFLRAVLADPRFPDSEAATYCREHGLIRGDAQTADDGNKGGLLVPAPLSAAIIRVVDEVGITRQLADVVPMTSETLDMSKRSAGLTVYAPAEGAAITTSEMQWTRVSLSTVDRATLTRISNKLLRSAVTSIADRVAEEIGQAFGWQQDQEFIKGDGTSTYFGETGLQQAVGAAGIFTTATTSEDTWAELTLANHESTMAILPSKYRQMPVWICSPAYYYTVMLRLLAAAGGNTITSLEGGGNLQFLGYPVILTDHMPTATAVSTVHALFGNFRAAAMLGDRTGISIATSTERYFDSDEIAIRGIVAYDINVHEPGDASNAGAYVALKTGAAS